MKKIISLALLALLPTVAFAADTVGKVSVRTATKSDVQTQQSGADGATLEQVSANNTAQAAGGSWVLPAIVQSALPTYSTNGNLVGLTVDASGRLYVTIDSTVTVQSNIKQINGAAPSATNPFAAQLTDGTASYVGAKTGQLPTALGQQTKAASVSMTLASDQGTLPVSQGAPTGAATARGTPVNIASAGTSTLTCVGSLTVSTPLKLYQVEIAGAAQGRCTLRYNNNGATTSWFDVVTSPAQSTIVAPCPAGFCGITAGTTGTQAIEASCTNFDAAAQDFSCSVQYCSAASGC
jgi:hypothetical protein